MRRNGTLFAHVVMVRAGKSPFPGDHKAQQHNPDDESSAWYHYFPDLVYARGTITRHMVGRASASIRLVLDLEVHLYQRLYTGTLTSRLMRIT